MEEAKTLRKSIIEILDSYNTRSYYVPVVEADQVLEFIKSEIQKCKPKIRLEDTEYADGYNKGVEHYEQNINKLFKYPPHQTII